MRFLNVIPGATVDRHFNPLTLNICIVLKDIMEKTYEIKTSLKREYDLYTSAMAFYKTALKEFEQKHKIKTRAFIKKFESGQLGDESDFFDWYAFAKLPDRWRKAQTAIRSAIQ